MDPENVPARFKVRSFTRFWDNRDLRVLSGVANPQSWGKGRGSGMVPQKRAFVTSYIGQGSCGSLKVLEFFSRFSRPGKSLKTDMVLESA